MAASPLAPSPLTLLLAAVQVDLQQAGIARRMLDAGPLPPLWMAPDEGVPAPGESQGPAADAATVLGIVPATEVSVGVTENWHRLPVLDAWIRTKGGRPVQRAADIDHAIRGRWVGFDSGLARSNFLLAAGTPEELRVIQCVAWRGLQQLSSSEQHGYTFVASYAFELYA